MKRYAYLGRNKLNFHFRVTYNLVTPNPQGGSIAHYFSPPLQGIFRTLNVEEYIPSRMVPKQFRFGKLVICG